MAEYIEREAVIDTVGKWLFSVFGMKETDRAATVFKKLRSIPAADVRPVVRGKWISKYPLSTCSVCEKSMILCDFANFCPNCGADMREEI